eukprot:2849305-Pleurochrysis_carterae.AAC.1
MPRLLLASTMRLSFSLARAWMEMGARAPQAACLHTREHALAGGAWACSSASTGARTCGSLTLAPAAMRAAPVASTLH